MTLFRVAPVNKLVSQMWFSGGRWKVSKTYIIVDSRMRK